MGKMLTAKAVEQAKPHPTKRLEIPDQLLTGFYLVIQPSGAKSWAIRYRYAGRTRKLTLGPFPTLGLNEARDAGREALRAVVKGQDAAAQKRAARHRATEGRDVFKNVVDQFIERHAMRNRSWPEVRRMFEHDVLPFWGERQLGDITRRDVLDLLDRLTDRGVGTMTNRVYSVIRKLFNWAMARDMLAVSPCAGVRPPVPEVSRDRVLTDEELRRFWYATGTLGYPFGPLFRLLAFTGQRLGEVAKGTWTELDRDVWIIPKERAKNNIAHEVPLSAPALDIIDSLPRIAGGGYLFTTTGKMPVSGFSRAKANLDRLMREGEGPSIPEWRLHDLRRTVASGMARLGINLPVIEKVLNHTSGSFAGIVRVYQRHGFTAEKRAAMDAWGSFLSALFIDQPTNVTALRRLPHA